MQKKFGINLIFKDDKHQIFRVQNLCSKLILKVLKNFKTYTKKHNYSKKSKSLP